LKIAIAAAAAVRFAATVALVLVAGSFTTFNAVANAAYLEVNNAALIY